MGRAHEVRAASMAKTAAAKSNLYSRFGKELLIAAKKCVPDPDMNLALKRKIAEAKANQVPADVIKRAIEKAKGGTAESYDSCRYEGFGPGASTIIVDCLTDNTNRSYTNVKTCFNKAHAKLGVAGCVSFNYEEVGYFEFKCDDEEGMMEYLVEQDVDLLDLSVDEEGVMSIKVSFGDFAKAQDAIEAKLPGIEYDMCEITMCPNDDYVELTDEEDKQMWERLINGLNECDDVNKIYHNVKE